MGFLACPERGTLVASGTMNLDADVAQTAERVTRNDQVTGSIPVVGSTHSHPPEPVYLSSSFVFGLVDQNSQAAFAGSLAELACV